MYKMKYQVLSSEVDENSELKLMSLVNILQDCEGLHIDGLKVFNEELRKEKIGIFLSFRQVNIHKKPKLFDTLYLETFPYETKGYFGYRNTIIYNEKKEVLVTTNVLGTFTSLQTLRPTKVLQSAIDTLDEAPKFDMKYLPRKIDLRNMELVKEGHLIHIQKVHIDSYHHLNNAFYVAFAENMIPDDFLVEIFRAEYKVPVFKGDVVKPILYKKENNYIVIIENQKNDVCAIIEFR